MEILLAALVLAVVILVAADFFGRLAMARTSYAGESAYDAGRETFGGLAR